jgi:hypothetical protein
VTKQKGNKKTSKIMLHVCKYVTQLSFPEDKGLNFFEQCENKLFNSEVYRISNVRDTQKSECTYSTTFVVKSHFSSLIIVTEREKLLVGEEFTVYKSGK